MPIEDAGFELPQFDAAGVSANGIHHRIQPAMLGNDAGDELANSNFIGHVHLLSLKGGGLSAGIAFECGKLIRVVPGDDNFGASFKKSQADRAPQSTRTAGHEDYLT